jgi:hypothetical protein
MNCSRSLAHRGSYRSIYQVLVSVITANFAVAQPGLAATHSDETPAAHAATVSLPLHFEQNKGQTDESVRFINRSSSATTFFRVQDLVMRLPVDGGAGSTVLKMRFDGASDEVALNGGDALASTSSYFRGNDSEQWVKGAQHFASLSYRELYDGIDLIFHGHEGELRYDFIVAPDGDPRQIRLSFDGADDIALAENGDLVLGVSGNPIIHRAPVVYQDVDGERVYVDASFRIDDQNSVLFALADYDRSRTLVIDPVISYSTFLGGTGGDSGRSVRVDPVDQTIIVTGSTESLDFPLAGAVQTTPGVIDPPGWAPNPNATDATFLWVKDFGRTDNYSAKIDPDQSVQHLHGIRVGQLTRWRRRAHPRHPVLRRERQLPRHHRGDRPFRLPPAAARHLDSEEFHVHTVRISGACERDPGPGHRRTGHRGYDAQRDDRLLR